MPSTDSSILVIDTETTGTDPQRDQVIELSILKGLRDDAPCRTWRIKPAVAVPAEAQACDRDRTDYHEEGAPSPKSHRYKVHAVKGPV